METWGMGLRRVYPEVVAVVRLRAFRETRAGHLGSHLVEILLALTCARMRERGGGSEHRPEGPVAPDEFREVLA